MSTEISPAFEAQPLGFKWFRPLLNLLVALRFPALGITSLLVAWWFGGYLVANDPDMWAFANFAPEPTFHALYGLVASGEIWPTIFSSLYRILYGLFWGIVIGVPVGVLIGYVGNAMKVANVPFSVSQND
jgi:NitT/TauT family transport system permease protein